MVEGSALKGASYSNLQEEDLIKLGSFLIVAGSYFLAGGVQLCLFRV